MSHQSSYTGQRGRKALNESQKRAKKGVGKKTPDLIVDTVLPVVPDYLDPTAQDEWKRVGEYLVLTRRVSQLDVQSLSAYCTSYGLFADSIRPFIRSRRPIWGLVNGRPKPAKLLDVALDHGKIVFELAQKFGMTGRTRHLDHASSGRPALPSEIHELRGNTPQVRPRDSLPEWSPESVAKPDWLNEPVASREWDRLTQTLANVELWTPLDVGVIAVCCGSYSLLTKCMRGLQDVQLTLTSETSDTAYEHPLSVVYRRHLELCSAIWHEYGMSPHDRMKFHHAEGDQQGKLKLSVYMDEEVV